MAGFSVPILPIGGLNTTIAQGIEPANWSGAFDTFFAGKDQGQKLALERLWAGGVPRLPDGTLDYRTMTEQLARTGGAPQIQNVLGLESQRLQQGLPPISPIPPPPPQVTFPPSVNRTGTTAVPDETPGPTSDNTLRPNQQGNLTSPTEVPGSFKIEVGPTTSYAPEPKPDTRLPPQFRQTPDTGPPTGRFTPQSGLPQEALNARAEAPQRTAQATIPGIPTQPQGSFGEAEMRRLEYNADIYNEAARRAASGPVPNKELAATYQAAANRAKEQAQAIREGLIKGQVKQTETQIEQEKVILDEGRKNYETAKSGLYRLGLIDDNIKKLGPSWMGSGADARAGAARAYNTIISLLPEEARKLVSPINPEKVATWEDFNKQSLNLGFELARTLGAREAMQIVQQATASVPNAQQSYWGARLVAGAMRQAFQRQQDYHEYLIQLRRSGRSVLDADVTFNQTHPVQSYINRATASVPPQRAIEFLQANPTPQNKKAFNQKYGDGATIGVFGTD